MMADQNRILPKQKNTKKTPNDCIYFQIVKKVNIFQQRQQKKKLFRLKRFFYERFSQYNNRQVIVLLA